MRAHTVLLYRPDAYLCSVSGCLRSRHLYCTTSTTSPRTVRIRLSVSSAMRHRQWGQKRRWSYHCKYTNVLYFYFYSNALVVGFALHRAISDQLLSRDPRLILISRVSKVVIRKIYPGIDRNILGCWRLHSLPLRKVQVWNSRSFYRTTFLKAGWISYKQLSLQSVNSTKGNIATSVANTLSNALPREKKFFPVLDAVKEVKVETTILVDQPTSGL